MRQRITTAKHLAKAMGEHSLMVTHSTTGKEYATTHGVAVSSKLAKSLLDSVTTAPAQADLFLAPNEDGLFPGFSQTWSMGQ